MSNRDDGDGVVGNPDNTSIDGSRGISNRAHGRRGEGRGIVVGVGGGHDRVVVGGDSRGVGSNR